MRWTIRLGFVGALLALGVLVAGMGTAAAGKSVKSKVKITKIADTGAKGKVASRVARCKRKRAVVLFVRNELSNPYGESGAKRMVGSTKSNRKGRWRIKATLAAGDYSVTVKPKGAGKKRCRGASTRASLG